MAVARMAAGSCCGTFGTFQGCQKAISKAGKTTWLWPKWRLEAAAALLEHFRAAKRQVSKAGKTIVCGPKWRLEAAAALLEHFRAAKRQSPKPVRTTCGCGPNTGRTLLRHFWNTFQGLPGGSLKPVKPDGCGPNGCWKLLRNSWKHLRAAKRQSQKPVNPDGCGPNGSWEQHATAAKRKLRRPVTFHTSGGPRRHPCLVIGRGRRI